MWITLAHDIYIYHFYWQVYTAFYLCRLLLLCNILSCHGHIIIIITVNRERAKMNWERKVAWHGWHTPYDIKSRRRRVTNPSKSIIAKPAKKWRKMRKEKSKVLYKKEEWRWCHYLHTTSIMSYDPYHHNEHTIFIPSSSTPSSSPSSWYTLSFLFFSSRSPLKKISIMRERQCVGSFVQWFTHTHTRCTAARKEEKVLLHGSVHKSNSSSEGRMATAIEVVPPTTITAPSTRVTATKKRENGSIPSTAIYSSLSLRAQIQVEGRI